MKIILKLTIFLYGFLCFIPYAYANSNLSSITVSFLPYQFYEDSLITVNDTSNKLYFSDYTDLNKVYILDLNKNVTSTVVLNMGVKEENDNFCCKFYKIECLIQC